MMVLLMALMARKLVGRAPSCYPGEAAHLQSPEPRTAEPATYCCAEPGMKRAMVDLAVVARALDPSTTKSSMLSSNKADIQ